MESLILDKKSVRIQTENLIAKLKTSTYDISYYYHISIINCGMKICNVSSDGRVYFSEKPISLSFEMMKELNIIINHCIN